MPIELEIIRPSDFIRFDAGHHLDFEKSKDALEQMALACRKRGLDRAVVDVRDLPVADRPRFTNVELAALVGAFRAAGFSRHQRLALLYRHDLYGNVRNFTFFGRMHGLQVQAFHEFENAMDWLWRDTERLGMEHGTEVSTLAEDATKRGKHSSDRLQTGVASRPKIKRRNHR